MMTTRMKNWLWFFLTFGMTLALFLYTFQEHYFNPDKLLIDLGFDGFKNYFTFGYHVRHGGDLHFDGMLYPYGDNILYADAQPGISIPLYYLNLIFPWIGDNSSLIVNYLIAISVSIGAVIVARIYTHFKLPILWAAAFGITASLMSPQIFRMSLHHALTYTFVIPSFILILLKLRDSSSLIFKILVGLFVFLIAFIHPYYLMMLCLLLLGFIIVRRHFDIKTIWSNYQCLIIPVAIVALYVKLASTGDRPNTPFGIVHFKADLYDLILPHSGKLSKWLAGQSDFFVMNYNEGSAYLGIAGLIGILSIIIGLVNSNWHLKFNRDSTLSLLIVSIPALLWATFWPFYYLGTGFIEDLPFINQFRGSGRFMWVVYYLLFIAGTMGLYQLLNILTSSVIKNLVLVLMLLVSSWEVYQHLDARRSTQLLYAGRDQFLVSSNKCNFSN